MFETSLNPDVKRNSKNIFLGKHIIRKFKSFKPYLEYTMNKKIENNKNNAINFYKMAYEGNPQKAVELYVGSEYIQHNPLVDNGTKPFIDYFERMHKEYPNKNIEFVRAIAQENLVSLHTHQIWPNGDEFVTMDFFRFDDNGKIVEHWDAIQKIPKESANNNTMY